MSAVELFTYSDANHVRVVRDNDGEPWFVLADLCRVLGLANVKDVRDRLADGVDQTYPIVDSLGRTQNATIVSEAGMYEVVIRSDKPEAVVFRRWITTEVLPAIRRTGTYSHYPAAPQQLPSKRDLAQWVIEAEERADREAAARLEAEARARELAVPASAWNELADAAGDYAVSDAAKVLSRDPLIDVKERALFAYMAGLGWVFKRDGRWKAYRTQLDTGRLAEKVGKPYLRDGVMHNGEPTVRITPKGLAELHHRLGGSGSCATDFTRTPQRPTRAAARAAASSAGVNSHFRPTFESAAVRRAAPEAPPEDVTHGLSARSARRRMALVGDEAAS